MAKGGRPSYDELAARVAALEAAWADTQGLRERLTVDSWDPRGGEPRLIGSNGKTQPYVPNIYFPSQTVQVDEKKQRLVIGAPTSAAFGGLPVPEGLTGWLHPAFQPSTQTMSALYADWVRLVMPKSGTLTAIFQVVAVQSGGQMACAVYDTASPRARLAAPAAVSGFDNVLRWRNLGNPNLAVTAGQQLDIATISSTTASHVIFQQFAGSTSLLTLPAAMWPSDGGASLMAARVNLGTIVFPATVAEASLGAPVGDHVPLIYARVT